MFPHKINKGHRRPAEAGISLIELLVVMTLIVAAASIVAARYGSAQQSINRQNVAHSLKSSLDRARADSIKRRPSSAAAMSRVVLVGPNIYSLVTDLDQNGNIDTNESRAFTFNNGVTRIVGDSLTFPVTIAFDRKGFATATNGSGAVITPVFSICDGCTASTISSANTNTITVSATGTTSIADGQALAIAVDPASISTVSTTSGIRSGAVISPPSGSSPPSLCNLLPILCL